MVGAAVAAVNCAPGARGGAAPGRRFGAGG